LEPLTIGQSHRGKHFERNKIAFVYFVAVLGHIGHIWNLPTRRRFVEFAEEVWSFVAFLLKDLLKPLNQAAAHPTASVAGLMSKEIVGLAKNEVRRRG
jgi:hypothetical protein